jgi:hypothetical protein
MRTLAVTSLLLGSLLLTAGTAQAADTVVDSVKKACNKELTTFCKDVKAGQGRVLACLYAHEDKVSGQCEGAIYDAVEQLEQALVRCATRPPSARPTCSSSAARSIPGRGASRPA